MQVRKEAEIRNVNGQNSQMGRVEVGNVAFILNSRSLSHWDILLEWSSSLGSGSRRLGPQRFIVVQGASGGAAEGRGANFVSPIDKGVPTRM